MKNLNRDFIDKTMVKIKTVMQSVLDYYGIKMEYDLNTRNELFCEVIKKTVKDLTITEMFKSITNTLGTTTDDLTVDQSEWLSEQIYKFNRDIFILHYFYAILYSYNYDSQIQEKITKEQMKAFFEKANEIHKHYKNLTLVK